MATYVCVDASLILMLLLPEEHNPSVTALWRSWVEERTIRIAPPLLFAEVTSVLREKTFHGQLPDSDAERAFAQFTTMKIETANPTDLQLRAWALAKKYNRPKAYDAQYLAVAESLGCELWTADQRLANAVREEWLKYAR